MTRWCNIHGYTVGKACCTSSRYRAPEEITPTRPFPWRAIINGPDDAEIVCGEFGNPSTFARIAECHTAADALFIVNACNEAFARRKSQGNAALSDLLPKGAERGGYVGSEQDQSADEANGAL